VTTDPPEIRSFRSSRTRKKHGFWSRKLRTAFHSPTTTLARKHHSRVMAPGLSLLLPHRRPSQTLLKLAPISSTPAFHPVSASPSGIPFEEPSGSKRSTSFATGSSPDGISPGRPIHLPAFSFDHACQLMRRTRFHPARLFGQYRYKLPPEFPLASPCAGIVHHLSGPNGCALARFPHSPPGP